MGLMEAPTAVAGRLVVTPHPVTLEGQTNVVADLRPGESLYAFLQRHVAGLDGEAWVVSIGGVEIPREHWHRVKPKHGQHVEVRAAVGRTALLLIATVALAYFTLGAGGLAGGSFLGLTGAAGTIAASAAYVGGSILINKVLGPKPGKAGSSDADSVYALRGAQNQARPFAPLGLLFGSVRIAADLASSPYTWYEGNQQYLGMVLTPGLNVNRVEALYNGDALLSSFEGVQVWHNGFPGMTDEDIPLYSNADTLAGGELDAENKGQVGPWVQRTSSPDTIKLQVDIEFLLFDTTSKGKPKDNSETFQIQYRAVGSGTWLNFGNYSVTSRSQRTHRVSYTKDVAAGQYDVRVRIAGNNTDGSGATARFTWSTLTSIQRDEASYAGIPRIGVRIQASGQLSGAPDELRCVAHSTPSPVWNGTAWVTEETSNPGAHILRYARGIHDPDGRRIAGIGLPDNMIDIPALQAFMLHCAANEYTYDYWVTEPRSHEEMLNALALAGFGQITWASGKLSVAWAAEDQPLSGVVNMATIKRSQFQIDYTLANAADGVEYTFLDRNDWQPKPLRVAAPGVTTMLNPAQVQGEGITTEAHAAQLARWHLAQSLYQYKDITYGTHLEHLSYRRLSVLALQHDLTQWGYGGRVQAAVNAAGIVTLTLDEPVPSPPSGNAWIGLRIPGERVYRVFQVAAFTGPSKIITLAEAWPGDAALPGGTADNPAWDTIWVYDFKQTPGLRVRVVGIEPEDDLAGARVSVVPESPEFWTYVKTGEYTPPANQSLLQTRPVASNVRITEGRVPQGNTVFIEITATFEVSGPVGVTVVQSAIGTEPLVEVAQTFTRTATWRVPEEGTYTFVIRPYSPEGVAGVPATIVHATAGAAVPPFDTFSVVEIGAGVRRYQWGYLSTTIQPPNLAGAEIRYTAGSVPDPDWEAMTPVGEGFHTNTFEAVVPPAGTWTFAVRARNTDGLLSVPLVTTATLGVNLVEQINSIQSDADDLANALAQEALDRFNADAAVAAAAAADATAKANAALDAALAASASAVPWDSGADYLEGQMVLSGGNLYLALQDVPAGTPLSDVTYWQFVGEYENIGSALAASITIGEANATELAAQGTQLDAVEASLADKADASALNALEVRVTENEGDISTLATNLSSVEASLAGKADASAVTLLEGRVDTVEDGVSANSLAVTKVNARLSGDAGNLVTTFDFTAGIGAWAAPAYTEASIPSDPVQVPRLVLPPGTESYQSGVPPIVASPGDVFDLSINMLNTGSAVGQFGLAYFNAAGSPFQWAWLPAAAAGTWAVGHKGTLPPAPAGTVGVMPVLVAGSDNYLLVTRPSVTRRDATGANNVSAISALQANATGSGNLLVNSAFDKQLQEWEWGSNPGGGAHVYVTNDSDPGVPKSKNAAIMLYGSTGGPSLFRQKRRSVTPGKTYIASGYFSGHQGGIRVWGINNNGSYYGELGINTGANGGGGDLSGWTRRSVKFTVPGGVTWVWVQFGGLAGTPGGFLRATNMMLEEARDANQVNPSPWSLGGYEYYASYTLSLDVNGYVSGFQSSNNGLSADFAILADVFRIIKPGGGARTEFSNGNWRVYDTGGVLRVRMGVW